MQHERFSWSYAPALVGATLALCIAGVAGAQEEAECDTDTDCGHGFICEKGEYTACPDIACVEGSECDQPACEPTSYAYCALAPCDEDADCPDGLTCATNEYQDCVYPDVVCEDGQEATCKRPEPTSCETVTEHYCAPPWELPCTADADCGEGFTCVELESCMCSGSAGSAGGTDSAGTDSADGGTPDSEPQPIEPVEPDCSCEPSGEFWCQQEEITCTDDAGCPDGWSCEQSGVTSVACAPPMEGGGEPVCDTSAPEPQPMTCQPPYYNQGGGRGFIAAEADLAATSGVAQNGAPQPAALGGDDGAAGGAESAGDDAPAASSGSGCSVSGASGAAQLGWLVAPLFVLGWSRRRARR